MFKLLREKNLWNRKFYICKNSQNYWEILKKEKLFKILKKEKLLLKEHCSKQTVWDSLNVLSSYLETNSLSWRKGVIIYPNVASSMVDLWDILPLKKESWK